MGPGDDFALLQCFLCERGKSTIGFICSAFHCSMRSQCHQCVMLSALHNTQAFHNAINFTQQTCAVTFGQCTFTVNSTLTRGSCIVFQAKLLLQFLNIFIYLVESVAFWHSVKCTSVQPGIPGSDWSSKWRFRVQRLANGFYMAASMGQLRKGGRED